MTNYRKPRRSLQPPAKRNGNLYYLRLNTPVGLMYKLGFTTLASAQERLAYQGNRHEKYIDSVLCFVYLEDAWDVEQALHKHFARKALFYGRDESMPLFGNGQSELYRDDILGMDEMYREEQSEKTRVNILAENYKRYGATDESVQKLIKNEESKYRNSWHVRMRAEKEAPAAPPSLGVRVLALILRPLISLIFGCAEAVGRFVFAKERAAEEHIKALLVRIEDARIQQVRGHERARCRATEGAEDRERTPKQATGRQLAIAAQLNQDIERGRLIALIKRISSEDAVAFLSTRQALDGDLIERFADRWDWKWLSWNKALPWSLELIERFADRWHWLELSESEALPWSLELIERFEDRWEWWNFNNGQGGFSANEALPWSIELIERFADRWSWGGLSGNAALPWALDLIERFEDRWDWKWLSMNAALPWSLDLIERFEDRWDWGALSKNKALSLPVLRPVDIVEIMAHHFTD